MFMDKETLVMKRSVFTNRFDLDITLRDASVDLGNRPTRRMLAAAAIGMDVEDSYFSTVELREAVEVGSRGCGGRQAEVVDDPR
jgi:hypothetical protein